MFLQANLKAESTTKTLLQRCQDLVKIIDEYPAKVAAAASRPTADVGRLYREAWKGRDRSERLHCHGAARTAKLQCIVNKEPTAQDQTDRHWVIKTRVTTN